MSWYQWFLSIGGFILLFSFGIVAITHGGSVIDLRPWDLMYVIFVSFMSGALLVAYIEHEHKKREKDRLPTLTR